MRRYIPKRTPDMHITSSELTVERFWGQNKMLKICLCKYLKRMPVTVRLLWPGPLGQCLPIGLQENSNTFQEGWLKANQQLVKENNKLLKAPNLINSGKRFFKNVKCFTRQYSIQSFTYMTSRKHRGHVCLISIHVVYFVLW